MEQEHILERLIVNQQEMYEGIQTNGSNCSQDASRRGHNLDGVIFVPFTIHDDYYSLDRLTPIQC